MTFAALHRPGDPLILPNAWDVGSARALAAAGFPALGTTSLGVAASRGLPDATREGRESTIDSTRRLVAADLGCFLTCDIEDGFSDDAGEVAELVSSLAVDGVNIEDASDGTLVEPEVQAEKICAVKLRAPGVFVNARTDVFWLGTPDLDEAVRRARIYVDAGADGIFLPGAVPLAAIEVFVSAVGAPVNVLASSAYTRQDLAAVGVARISTGSLLYRAALTGAVDAAKAVRDGRAVAPAMSYADVQALHTTRV
jgi:2-methylisocitrate lyase-like PEP mutase family enzyme